VVEFCFIANIRIKKLHHTPSDRSYKEIKGNSSTKQIQSLFFFYQLLKITILKQNKIATVTRKQKKKIVFCWPYIIYYFNKISTTLCTVIENTILNNWSLRLNSHTTVNKNFHLASWDWVCLLV